MAWAAAQLLHGPGNLYWNRGMHLGLAAAMQQPSDYLLWLNDDTQLLPDALARLLAESQQLAAASGAPVLLVGTTADEHGRITYGGAVSQGRWRPFTYQRVSDPARPVVCEVINGNCVLVPWAIAQRVGNVDPRFEHAMGDTDYALRCLQLGFKVYAGSGLVGHCSANSRAQTHLDKKLPLAERWRRMQGPKGLPWRSWLHFTRRHGGPLWFVYFGWPYVRLILGVDERA